MAVLPGGETRLAAHRILRDTWVQNGLGGAGGVGEERGGCQGDGKGGPPGHSVKANAELSQERERAALGAQNKICSIPSVSTLFQKMTY